MMIVATTTIPGEQNHPDSAPHPVLSDFTQYAKRAIFHSPLPVATIRY